MAKESIGNFYKTSAWRICREAYMKSVGGLCERCYASGIIRHGDTVHHKIHLTPENINDPEITLNFQNLQCLCRSCHAEVHKTPQTRYQIDENGRITGIE